MKKEDTNIFKLRFWLIPLLFLFSLASFVRADNHIVSFGGPLGLNYSPAQLTVAVGDSITWLGSFSSHPLISTSIPPAAASFQKTSGNTFIYPVLVAGDYSYECDFHAGSGMKGTFNAIVTNIQDGGDPRHPAVFRLVQNYPNPFNGSTLIRFELPSAQQVELKVYAITGAVVATLVDAFLPAGQYSATFNAANLATGVYFYQLSGEYVTDTKRMILAK